MNPIIIYENAVKDSTITASSTAAGYNADYLKDYKTFTAWKGESSSSNNLVIDLGLTKFIGAISIIGHNLNDVGGKIKILKSDNKTAWTTVVEQFSVTTDNPVLKLISSEPGGAGLESLQGGQLLGLDGSVLMPLQSGANSARYWKIELETNSAPEIAVLFMGEYIRFEYPPETPVVPVREKIIAESSVSNEGHLLGNDVRYHGSDADFTFKNFTDNWYKTKLKKFWDEYGRWLNPFVFAWDADNRPDDVLYCKLSDQSVFQEPLSILNNVDNITLNLKVL